MTWIQGQLIVHRFVILYSVVFTQIICSSSLHRFKHKMTYFQKQKTTKHTMNSDSREQESIFNGQFR